jgi:8-oxo-dGTP pyrophosphatase MutT (NUDIX family)
MTPDPTTDPTCAPYPQVSGQGLRWHALAEARKQQRPRRAFVVDGEHVGSVDEAHLAALQPWSRWVEVREQAVVLTAGAAEREAVFAEINARLHEQGLIRAWRDEPFPLLSPTSGRVMAVFERAAARFWGTLTLGAHCNGWVAGPDGQPGEMWIARRSATKATDPGKLDNLIGGGVPWGQTPWETLVREGFEEAGLSPAQMARATPGRVIELDRDVPEGRQFERLQVFDLELQEGECPVNQDGEVAEVGLWSIHHTCAAASTDEMTVDAALVTLDFLLRRKLVAPPEAAAALEEGLVRLCAGTT